MARLRSEQKLAAGYNQGIARVEGGWILSGTIVLARVNEKLRPIKRVSLPIPTELRVQGYNHVGDVDAVGKYVYAPLEQPDFEKGEQITALYDVKTLKFVELVTVPQHENSFVTVDPKTMTAYSMDRFGGDALLRYDVRNAWAPLPPLPMSRFVDKVQGADVTRRGLALHVRSYERAVPRRHRERRGDRPRVSGSRGRRGRGHGRDAASVGRAPHAHGRREEDTGVAGALRRAMTARVIARHPKVVTSIHTT